MQIHGLQTDIEDIFNDPNFLVTLESHLNYLRQSPNLRILKITEHQNYKYEGDLYGLLDDVGIPKKYHYIVARVNEFDSSADFMGKSRHLFLPDFTEVDLIKTIYQSKTI